jgi:hypothetical protein
MVRVNQTWLHCVNQMRKTQSKALAERHGMCESIFTVPASQETYCDIETGFCLVTWHEECA